MNFLDEIRDNHHIGNFMNALKEYKDQAFTYFTLLYFGTILTVYKKK